MKKTLSYDIDCRARSNGGDNGEMCYEVTNPNSQPLSGVERLSRHAFHTADETPSIKFPTQGFVAGLHDLEQTVQTGFG